MKCPKCQFENREGAKFCGKCRAKLSPICPSCGSENPPENIFCDECGHDLQKAKEAPPKDLSFDEKIDKIQRYLPKGLTEKILSQRDKIEGERKQVAVMFCDMEGFTPLSDLLGIEEGYALMDQVYEILIHKVHDYEGTVNEMTGDGIMALFGAPIALEDASQRAVRSSLAIHRELAKFSEKLKQGEKDVPPIKMRVGINTGPVVVGTVGNNLRVEFKAVGDTVNLASRMEGQAEPGSTYITENTFRLTEGLFRFEALGKRTIKGKHEPVKIYRVIAPSTRRTRFDVSAERGLTPFVERERELEILLDAFERSKSGRGQAVSIVSEAGVGKSRLLYEFRKAIAHEDVTFLEGKCLSYSRGVAYHPVIDILKANFNIDENDEDPEIRLKVKEGLNILKADPNSTLPFILELISVKESGIDNITLNPVARKDGIMEALRQIVLKGSEIRPLILTYEDLHWIDKSSEDVLKYILDSLPGARVLMIFTYRPEFVHKWGGKSYHSHATLNRLSNRESIRMASFLLESEQIDSDLEELILEKTEGVPFFIEEFIRSLKDLKIIKRTENQYVILKAIQMVSLPATIQEVIMARVDSMPEDTKEIIQMASAIEREFSHELIKRVTGLPEQKLLSYLSILKDAELIYERGIYPQSTYIFKHALTREVVYDSILTKRKKKLHEQIGNAIEELCKENIHEYYAVLADHFITSEEYEKGAEYSKLTAKKARKEGSFNDSIVYGKKRVSCLEKLPESGDLRNMIIDARVTLGLYYNQVFSHYEAKEAIDPIFAPVLERENKRELSNIYTIMGTHSFEIEGDYPSAFKYLKNALNIAEKSQDNVSSWAANHWLGHALAEHCEFERAHYHIKNALEIVGKANDPWSTYPMKGCIAMTVYNNQGRVDLSYPISLESLKFAEHRSDSIYKAEAYSYHGYSCYLKGLLNEAEEYLSKGIAICERINSSIIGSFANFVLGETLFDKKKYQKSQDHHSKAIILLESCNVQPYKIGSKKIALSRAQLMNNEKDIDIESLLVYVAQNKMKLYDGMLARFI
ncbi:AAA family ATPase, partial [Thermodesulfobacteriota bacterium]